MYSETIDTIDLEDEKSALEARRDDEEQTDPLDVDEVARLNDLTELADELGSEWQYGITLIPESDFVEYAQEMAEEIGAINHIDEWPATCIDWEQAARQLAYDYTSISFDGTDYLCRP